MKTQFDIIFAVCSAVMLIPFLVGMLKANKEEYAKLIEHKPYGNSHHHGSADTHAGIHRQQVQVFKDPTVGVPKGRKQKV